MGKKLNQYQSLITERQFAFSPETETFHAAIYLIEPQPQIIAVFREEWILDFEKPIDEISRELLAWAETAKDEFSLGREFLDFCIKEFL